VTWFTSGSCSRLRNKNNCFYAATLNWFLWSNQQTQHVLQKCHVFFRLKVRSPNISRVDIVHATSPNKSRNYIFTASVGTSSSTYTNISTMTTHLFFMYPSLNTVTGSRNIIKFIYKSRTEQKNYLVAIFDYLPHSLNLKT